MSETIYLSLKSAHAAKAGQHSKGQISYRVLTDELHQHLFLTIVGVKQRLKFDHFLAKTSLNN